MYPPFQTAGRDYKSLNHLRNKGGYTSLVSDMGVQWDFGDNCGHGRGNKPFVRISDFRENYPPSFYARCGGRNRRTHSYRIGDLGSVCQHCGLYVPHGEYCPTTGDLPEIEDPIISEEYADMQARVVKSAQMFHSSRKPFTITEFAAHAGARGNFCQGFVRKCIPRGYARKLGFDPSGKRLYTFIHRVDHIAPKPIAQEVKQTPRWDWDGQQWVQPEQTEPNPNYTDSDNPPLYVTLIPDEA